MLDLLDLFVNLVILVLYNVHVVYRCVPHSGGAPQFSMD